MFWRFLHKEKRPLRSAARVRVLFVCMGNICRSPVAEGVFRRLVEEAGLSARIDVDSAGTHAYRVGVPPDPRSQASALRRGVDLRNLRARRVTEVDFLEFDYLLAMDRENVADLLERCQDPALRSRVRLLMDFAPRLPEREVPDPYYGGPGGFDRVMELIEQAAQGLLLHLRERHRL